MPKTKPIKKVKAKLNKEAKNQFHPDLLKRNEWYKEADKQTLETLPAFLDKLVKFEHTYNTICYAIATGAVATAHALDRSPHGGITGFQAEAIMWEFIRGWLDIKDKPMRLIRYEEMLYPQYDYHFDRCITQDTWKWLQKETSKLLSEKYKLANPLVLEHWKHISQGKVPFGYKVVKSL
jgi:hypothetical protein